MTARQHLVILCVQSVKRHNLCKLNRKITSFNDAQLLAITAQNAAYHGDAIVKYFQCVTNKQLKRLLKEIYVKSVNK